MSEENRVAITEKDEEIIKAWFIEAKDGKTSVDEFIKKLNDNYNHDYGTICHAVAAAAVKAAWAMNAQPQGGITGFQAGAVMWEFIRHWNCMEGPARLINYNVMLYPQYANKFEKIINQGTWKWLQKSASEKLAESKTEDGSASSRVIDHWQSIIDGVVPFGYSVEKGEEDGNV
jgi:hypothetical protein